MLTELCKELNNWDFNKRADRFYGQFSIVDGSIAPVDFLQDGQYFRIVDSVFNDGVYQYPCDNLIDEVFDGSVWAMYVPPEVLKLSGDIDKFIAENETNGGNFISESFGGYSYTKPTDSDGNVMKWQTAFKNRLNEWRKLR